jgi:hypothetical protein
MSTLCLLISFDNDQLSIILIATTTASIDNLFADGTKMVLEYRYQNKSLNWSG